MEADRDPEDDPGDGTAETAPRPDRGEKLALIALLSLLAIRLLTLPVLPLTDSTESRYAQISAEMAETGDWVTPQIRIHDLRVPFLGKPPLFFWLGAGSVELFGRGELAARLPSLLCAIATVLLVLRLGPPLAGREGTRHAALLLGCGPLFFMLAGLVTLDMTLTVATTGAILLGLTHDPNAPRARRRSRGAMLATCLALGFLTKGPIVLAIVGAAALAVCLVRRTLDPLKGHAWGTGAVVLVAITAPWFALAETRNPGFLEYFFVQENWLRYTQSEIGDRYGSIHVFFPGVSMLWWLVAAAPALIAIPLAARAARKGAVAGLWNKPLPALIAASLGPAVLLAPSSQILVTYLLPVAPIAALAGGLACSRAGIRIERTAGVALLLAAVFFAGHLAARPKLDAERSTRDAITRARELRDAHGLRTIAFPRKTPWSAYYYGGDEVVPLAEDRYLFRALETLARQPDAVYLLKERERRRLPADLLERFDFVDQVGIWHLALPAEPVGIPRTSGAGTGRISPRPTPAEGGL